MEDESSIFDWKKQVDSAHIDISKYLKNTPLIKSEILSKKFKCNVWLKLESSQPTGSFKVRGAFNKTLATNDKSKETSIKPSSSANLVTASSGNHAQACCEAWSQLGRKGCVFVPSSITSTKLNALKAWSHVAEIHMEGDECCQTEAIARNYANEHNLVYISPYNDKHVIAGQGTCAKEVLSQLPSVDVVYVCVGGGGLMSGIAVYLKALKPQVRLVGCQPLSDAVMFKSIKAGRLVSYEEAGSVPTISQATAGAVEAGSLTFPLCRELVDCWHLLSEEEIALGALTIIDEEGRRVEPAVGLTVAALKKDLESGEYSSYTCDDSGDLKNIVLIVSSSNIGDDEIQAMRKLVASKTAVDV